MGICTAELGHRVYFTTAIAAARRLALAVEQQRLQRELNNLTRPKRLILDEVGYLHLDKTQASLLFQAICLRYERQGAIILTSNKAFGEWGEIFAGDVVMAGAALDRLVHRCTVITIRGESYRLKEQRQAGHHPLDRAPPTAPGGASYSACSWVRITCLLTTRGGEEHSQIAEANGAILTARGQRCAI